MMPIFDKIIQMQKSKKPLVLVTVISAKGSVPRESGAKMLVADGKNVAGTIGGGAVEKMVIDEAMAVLESGKPRLVKHELDDKQGADTGMVCGGKMEFFLEPLNSKGELFVFGGGHIALALSRLADILEWSYTVIEDREEFCNSRRFPNASACIVRDPAEVSENLDLTQDDDVVVITRGHAHDYEIIRQVLRKRTHYIGMIGSKLKRREVYSKLQQQDGFTENDLQRIHSPIGLDIGAQSPQEIAVSIVAELIQLKNKDK